MDIKEERIMLTKETWAEVLKELRKVNMFNGIYDAKNGKDEFMYGISTVMEFIANQAGDESFEDEFLENMSKSKERSAGGK